MIPDIAPVNSWTGNNETKKFEFDFLINSEEELKVLYTNVNQVQTELKLNIDYSINEIGNKNGSYITFPLDNSEYGLLQENETISLLLNIPLAQTTPFATSGLLNLNSLEYALDYIVRLIQIVYRQVERSVKIQEGSKDKPEDYFEYVTTASTKANEYANLAKDYADESETLKIETQSARNQSLAYLNEVRDITENFDADIQELVGYVDEAKNEGINAINNEKNNAINSINETGAQIIDKAEAWATSDKEIEKGLYSSKYYAELAKGYIPSNYTPLPIGSILNVNASDNYIPSGCLRCDGVEYNKADFEKLWDNYLTSEEWKYDENIEFALDDLGSTVVQLPITSGMTIVAKYNIKVSTVNNLSFAYRFFTRNLNVYFGNSQYVCEIDRNATFYAKYEITSDGYSVYYSLDGVDFTLVDSSSNVFTDIELTYSDDVPIDMTGSYYTIGEKINYFSKNKSLLNTCTYYEYEQNLATYGQCSKFAVKPLEYDGSQLTIVGSPSITENGVASGFTNSNYIKTPSVDISSAKNWEMKFRISLGSKPQSGINYGFCGNSNSGFNLIYNSSSYVVFNMSSSISGASATADMRFLAEENETYDIILGQNSDFSNFIKYKKASETEYLSGFSSGKYSPTKIMSINEALYLGAISSSGAQPATNGAIDLKYFSITIDGQTIFDCVEGDTFRVPTIEDTELGLKNFVVVSNGMQDDCQATWNTLIELENYLKGV